LSINKLLLTPNEQIALKEAKKLLKSKFPVQELMVFGSVARGKATEESDLDLLVITRRPVSHVEKHAMSDLVFEINLSNGTNISILVVDRDTWKTGLWSVLPLYQEVVRDGVSL
jgi:predicted nucleotidyltransferase